MEPSAVPPKKRKLSAQQKTDARRLSKKLRQQAEQGNVGPPIESSAVPPKKRKLTAQQKTDARRMRKWLRQQAERPSGSHYSPTVAGPPGITATEKKKKKKRKKHKPSQMPSAAPAHGSPGGAAPSPRSPASQETTGAKQAAPPTPGEVRRSHSQSKSKSKPARDARSQSASASAKAQRRKKNQVQDPSMEFIRAPAQTPIVKAARAFFAASAPHIQPWRVVVGPVERWRTVAKLAVRVPSTTHSKLPYQPPLIGLFEPGSHRVMQIPDCAAHSATINRAVQCIERCCAQAQVTGYDGVSSNAGSLSYLGFTVERATGKVQLTLVWNAQTSEVVGPQLQRLVQALCSSEKTLWHSIWQHFHPASRHDNAIYGREGDWVCSFPIGPHKAEAQVGTVERIDTGMPLSPSPPLYFPPFVFRQANLDAFAKIVREVRKWVRGRVVELYAGVGTIGLHLADLVESLSCSDENPHNEACFKLSLQALPPDLRAKLTYTTSPAGAMADRGVLRDADVVVVDPPRKGLDEEVLRALCPASSSQHKAKQLGRRKPARLVYVSCGFKAFQRDAKRLLEAGWRLIASEGHMLFPGADHVETVAVFSREN
eukprot:g51309.t1